MRRLLRLSTTAWLVCALGCTGSPRAPDDARSSTPAEPVPFVDAHVHLNDEGLQLEMMRRFGAQRAVVFWGRNSDNESIAEAARRHPDRFIAFASISPERSAYRKAWDVHDTALLQSLDEAWRHADTEMFASFGSKDFREGVAHYLEKRPPAFTGR